MAGHWTQEDPGNQPDVLYGTENPKFSKIYIENSSFGNSSFENWDEPHSNPVCLKQMLEFVGRLYRKIRLHPCLKTYNYFCCLKKKCHNMEEPQKCDAK